VENEDSRLKTVVEKVSRGFKWRRLVLPMRGILFIYRSVVHVLVIWAKLINTRGMGIGSVPCNTYAAYMNHTHNTLTTTCLFLAG